MRSSVEGCRPCVSCDATIVEVEHPSFVDSTPVLAFLALCLSLSQSFCVAGPMEPRCVIWPSICVHPWSRGKAISRQIVSQYSLPRYAQCQLASYFPFEPPLFLLVPQRHKCSPIPDSFFLFRHFDIRACMLPDNVGISFSSKLWTAPLLLLSSLPLTTLT